MYQTDEAPEALAALLEGHGFRTRIGPPSEYTERAYKRRKTCAVLNVEETPLESADSLPAGSKGSKTVRSLPRGRRRPSSKLEAQSDSRTEEADDSNWLTLARVDMSMVRAMTGDSTKGGTERGDAGPKAKSRHKRITRVAIL